MPLGPAARAGGQRQLGRPVAHLAAPLQHQPGRHDDQRRQPCRRRAAADATRRSPGSSCRAPSRRPAAPGGPPPGGARRRAGRAAAETASPAHRCRMARHGRRGQVRCGGLSRRHRRARARAPRTPRLPGNRWRSAVRRSPRPPPVSRSTSHWVIQPLMYCRSVRVAVRSAAGGSGVSSRRPPRRFRRRRRPSRTSSSSPGGGRRCSRTVSSIWRIAASASSASCSRPFSRSRSGSRSSSWRALITAVTKSSVMA